MGWFSIGAAALGALGSVYGNKSKEKVNDAQIAWERERATNAHQWEVEDLRKAGLNPILSAGGSGANTSPVNLSVPDSPLSAGINTALAVRSNKAEVEKLENENKLMRDSMGLQIDNLKQQLANSAKQYEKLQAEIQNINENTRNQEANNFLTKEGIEVIKPIVNEIKSAINNSQSGTSVIDDISRGASELWDDLSSLWKDDFDKPTPTHKNNDFMKGRRGRS